MKKLYVLATIAIISSLAITTVSAQTLDTPINPANTLDNKIKIIDQLVESGELDKDTAAEIKTELENCDGDATKKLGQKYDLHFGRNSGSGLGNGQGHQHASASVE